METMSPDTVAPPQEMTEEEKKLERKARLVKALSAINTRAPGSKKEPTVVTTEVEVQTSANSATAITPSTPTPIPAPKAPAAKPTTPVAAPKFPHKQLPANDKFGLPLSPRFSETPRREQSPFGRATRI